MNRYTAKRKKTAFVAAKEPLLGCTESRQCKLKKAHRIWDRREGTWKWICNVFILQGYRDEERGTRHLLSVGEKCVNANSHEVMILHS